MERVPRSGSLRQFGAFDFGAHVKPKAAPQLAAERRTGGAGFVFGSTATAPFVPSTVRRRARAAWKAANLEPIGLHECRHTFASLMIAAGVNVKALSTYMGHASVTITLDRYGHLFPGHEAEAVRSFDAYLARAAGPVREKVREADDTP
jgi:integrase